jgi:hypothetical protein
MSSRKMIKAKVLASDIWAGLSNSELMAKYKLSARGLRKAMRQLVDAGFLQTDEVTEGLPDDYHNRLSDFIRKQERYYIDFELVVCDAVDPAIRGLLIDIHEDGLRVTGIPAKVGEIKKLVVLGDEFGGVDPFELEVRCQWSRMASRSGDAEAGFGITGKSEENLSALRRLIEVVTGSS